MVTWQFLSCCEKVMLLGSSGLWHKPQYPQLKSSPGALAPLSPLFPIISLSYLQWRHDMHDQQARYYISLYNFLYLFCNIFVKLAYLSCWHSIHPWFISFSSLILLVARRNISKMPLSMCALMLPYTMIPICQCQPWILAKQWRFPFVPEYIHSLCGHVCAISSQAPPGPVSVCLCGPSVRPSDSYPQAAAWLVAAAYSCCLHQIFSA